MRWAPPPLGPLAVSGCQLDSILFFRRRASSSFRCVRCMLEYGGGAKGCLFRLSTAWMQVCLCVRGSEPGITPLVWLAKYNSTTDILQSRLVL